MLKAKIIETITFGGIKARKSVTDDIRILEYDIRILEYDIRILEYDIRILEYDIRIWY